jgi:hypothetical protein
MMFFSEIFPSAKFVHVVRDGRSVANSWLQMDWWGGYRGPQYWPWGPLPEQLERQWRESGSSFVVLAGLLWCMLVSAYRQCSETMGHGRYLEVRYEDFVNAPEDTLRVISNFIEIGDSTSVQTALRNLKIDRDRSNSYLQDLSKEQHILLESTMGQQLRAFKYQ